MFWIILTTAATVSARGPRKAPAATTAPVESMVPPIQAPPRTGSMPTQAMNIGMKIIISTVKISVMPTARVSSSFLARDAAATAMAAETPQTEVAAAMMITSGLLTIFRTRVPKSHMKMITVGVTIQATISPGTPMLRILPNRISAPSSTRPVLMYISVRTAGLSHPGVPMVLEISRPSSRAQAA